MHPFSPRRRGIPFGIAAIALVLAMFLSSAGNVRARVKPRDQPRAAPAVDQPASDPTSIIVRFKDDVSQMRQDRVVAAIGGQVTRTSRFMSGLCTVKIPAGADAQQVITQYQQRPDVAYAEPNYLDVPFEAPAFMPNDPLYSQQWNFEMIHMAAAWDLIPARGTSTVIVAIIDTGVAYENYGVYQQAPDLAGVNFVNPADVVDDDGHPNDADGHGTHVCGTIAQVTDNGLGVAGMADHVSIMPIRSLGTGGGSHAQFSDAVHWAVSNGAQLINYSAGGSDSTTKHDAVIYAYNNGVLLIAAYGNDSQSNPASAYPARYAEALGVGAVTRTKALAYYSNWGDGVDVVAPGGDTTASSTNGIIQNTFETTPTNFNYYGWMGTSMATPHVSGLAALLWSQGIYHTRQDVFDRLAQTCEDLGAAGYDATFGWGLINAEIALSLNPFAPTGVAASDGTYTDKVRVTWNNAAGATSYQVFRNTSNSSNGLTVFATSPVTNYDDTSATAGLTYYYWVKTANAASTSDFSGADSGYRALAAPTNAAASDGIYTDKIRVTWNAVADATAYQVWRNTTNDTSGASNLTGTMEMAYNDTSAAPGVQYYYWIKATNSLIVSAFSASDTGYRALDAPASVAAGAGTYTDKVPVTWDAVSNAGGYQLFRNTSDASNGLIAYAETASQNYDDTAVSFGVNYYYWVKATNALGAGAFSAAAIGYLGSTADILAAPTGVAASDGTYSNEVRVTWNAVTNALYYKIWRHTSNSTAAASVLARTTNTVTCDDPTVTAGVTWYYWIQAQNAQTTSVFSNPDSGYASYVPPVPAGNADLALMTLLFLPATLTTNQHPGAVSVQLINYGPTDLAAPNTRVALDLYLSTNATFGDGDDISLGDYTSDQTVSASSYPTLVVPASGRAGLTVPAAVTSGTYNVFARVRHTYPSTLVDPDETNNWVMRNGAITVTGDSGGGATDTGYHLINDYDGDGKSDLAVYQESSSQWEVMLSGSGYQTVGFMFGGPGYNPAPADYDGDGKCDPAIYQESSGTWAVMLSAGGYATVAVVFGGPGAAPAPADFDGDGKADPAVFLETTGTWQIMLSVNGYGMVTTELGAHDCQAVPADYDGDGKSDLAVYRRSTGDWYFRLSTLEYWMLTVLFGGAGSVPVPADYDGDVKTDPAVYRESSGEWNVMMSKYNYLPAQATHGGPGSAAVPADYDGDGKGDVVVYSASTQKLKILLSGSNYGQTVVSIGGPGYEPVGVVK